MGRLEFVPYGQADMNHFTFHLIKSPLAVLFTGAILKSDREKCRRGAKAKRLRLRFGGGASVKLPHLHLTMAGRFPKVPFSIGHAEISGSDGDRLAEH